MRCSDVIDVIVTTRRHVGGILSVNR